jgi:hypothetical protein
MPIFEKRRFQHGAAGNGTFKEIFAENAMEYRTYFNSLYA